MTKKKSNKMTTRIVNIPIYRGKLRVDIIDHPKESKLWKERFTCNNGCRNNNRPRTSFKGFTFGYKSGMCIMLQRTCTSKTCKDPECSGLTPGTIAHEAFHAAFRILDRAGVKPDVNNQEPFAYLLSWVVDAVNKTVEQDKQRNS